VCIQRHFRGKKAILHRCRNRDATVTQPINPYEAEVKTVADKKLSRKSLLGVFRWISAICALGQVLNFYGRFLLCLILTIVSDALIEPKMARQIQAIQWSLGIVELTCAFLCIGVPFSFLAVLLEKKRHRLSVFFLVCNLVNLVIYCLIYYVASQFFSKMQG